MREPAAAVVNAARPGGAAPHAAAGGDFVPDAGGGDVAGGGEAPRPGGLAERARGAVLWNTGFTVVRDLLQFGLMLILVRLVAPAAYGQFTLVTSITGFMFVFSARNVLAHTLQLRREQDVDFGAHFTFGAAVEAGLFLIANGVALALRWFPDYAQVAPLLHLMSLLFLVNWPKEICVKMLQRELDWKRFRLIYLAGIVLSSLLAVALALRGAGVYALLLPSLVAPLPFFHELFLRRRWRPARGFELRRLAPALRFGAARLGSELAGSGRLLLESAVFAASAGFGGLGVYGRALGLAAIACQKLSNATVAAVYPAITRLDPASARYRRAGALLLRLTAWFVLPAAIAFSLLGREAVLLIYGERWEAVIPILPWAMAAGAAGAVLHAAYMLQLGSQQERSCLVADLMLLAGTALSLVWLLPAGVAIYLQGVLATQACALAFVLLRLYRTRAIDGAAIVHSIGCAALAAAAAGALTAGAAGGWQAWRGTPAPALLECAVFLPGYLLALRTLFRRQMAEIVERLPGSRGIGSVLLLDR